MKIAVFTDTFTPCINGIVDVVIRVAKGLIKAGHQVHIFALSDNNKTIERDGFIVHNFKAKKFFLYPDYMIKIMPPIRRVLKIANKEKFDVIHSNLNLCMGYCALVLSKLKGIPLISTYHTLLPYFVEMFIKDYNNGGLLKRPKALDSLARLKLDKSFYWIINKLMWWWVKYFNLGQACITPSSFTKKVLMKRGLIGDKIHVIPNPIDLGTYKKKSKHKTPIILHVGRHSLEKRINVLIRALSMVKSDYKCIIASDGPLKNQLIKLTNELGLAKKVTFTGFVSKQELNDLYNNADLFVTPAIYDTFNNCIAEALVHKLPVIVNNESGAQDFVKDGVNGVIINDGKPDNYAKKIDYLLNNKRLLTKLSKSSDEVKEYVNIERIIKLTEQVYAEKHKRRFWGGIGDFIMYIKASIFFNLLIIIAESFEK